MLSCKTISSFKEDKQQPGHKEILVSTFEMRNSCYIPKCKWKCFKEFHIFFRNHKTFHGQVITTLPYVQIKHMMSKLILLSNNVFIFWDTIHNNNKEWNILKSKLETYLWMMWGR